MIIDYASDLHMNHWMIWTENQLEWEKRTRALTRHLIRDGHGEVLVLAGDFSEWNCQSLWILNEAAKYYERVFFTFGNHDLYLLSKSQQKKYSDSLGRLEELIKQASHIPNVVPLIKETYTYKGITFAGDAMWYLPTSPEDWSFYRNISNDSDCIKIAGCPADNIPRLLHKESLDWYESLDNQKIDVFVSHVPPVSDPSLPFGPNSCYVTEVPFLAAKHWICGHDHLQSQFEKAGTHFHMNAIGYAGHYSNYRINSIPEERPDDYKLFGIKSFTI